MKGKSIQISEELFFDLCEYFFAEEPSAYLHEKISTQLDEKAQARVRRNMFTQYKTAKPNDPKREQARQAYLDEVGCLPDWRSKEEFSD